MGHFIFTVFAPPPRDRFCNHFHININLSISFSGTLNSFYYNVYCRFRAARICDFVEALIVMHRQFDWSYPILSDGSRVSSTSKDSSKLCKAFLCEIFILFYGISPDLKRDMN